jgi:hypothetical protein
MTRPVEDNILGFPVRVSPLPAGVRCALVSQDFQSAVFLMEDGRLKVYPPRE